MVQTKTFTWKMKKSSRLPRIQEITFLGPTPDIPSSTPLLSCPISLKKPSQTLALRIYKSPGKV
jgi:hypothetical protein